MKRKPLVSVPLNGNLQKQLEFENEKKLTKFRPFYADTIDLITTLKNNRITNKKAEQGTTQLFADGPTGIGRRLFDHIYIASDVNGKYYFIAEPYIGVPTKRSEFNGVNYVYEEVVASVAQWCRANDLDLEVRLNGPHHDDTTMFIISGYDQSLSEKR